MRLIEIIGITDDVATKTFKLSSIEQLINQSCIKLLSIVVSLLQHPLTRKLNKVSDRSKAIYRVKCNKAKTKGYENSLVQKYIRMLRDGTIDIYTTRNNQNPTPFCFPVLTKLDIPQIKCIKKLSSCPICGNQYKAGAGISSKIRETLHKTSKLHNSQNHKSKTL